MLSEALGFARALYEIPADDVVRDVLVPALRVAEGVDIAVGYFSSLSFAALAPGLTAIADRGVTCRLLLSPEISDADLEAIERGLRTPDDIVAPILDEPDERSPSALARYGADMLAYLVARDALAIRCVLMKHGMFHKKVWLIRDRDDCAAIHGSGNLTRNGMFVNGEQMTVDCSWWTGDQITARIHQLTASFEAEWNNEREEFLTIEPDQMIAVLRARGLKLKAPPSIDDFWAAWIADFNAGLEPPLPPGVDRPHNGRQLSIPKNLRWQDPPFAHQREAIDALERGGRQGLLAIATGGGKTKTALIAATRIQDEAASPCLVLVLVPTTVLARQWAAEVREFGVEPLVLTGMGPETRRTELVNLSAALASGMRRTEVVITTLQLFTGDPVLRSRLDELAGFGTDVLIADEAHNFGALGFIADPPTAFQRRIGLSATPIRQYDDDGTQALFDYFGGHSEPLYSFTVRDAIAAGCLTPYRYHLHAVEFSDAEMERFDELTGKLRRLRYEEDERRRPVLTEAQQRLLQERRGLVEQADGKVEALRELLARDPEHVERTLVYCSAKAVALPHTERQIESVVAALASLRIPAHQYTAAETGTIEGRSVLESFRNGDLKAIVAMKVLDEGVDVPDAHTAYLLSSSTVEREWIQRRGRVLRRSPGKDVADLHDFIVVPPSRAGEGTASLLRSELKRAEHFATDAANSWDTGGPRDVIATIEMDFGLK